MEIQDMENKSTELKSVFLPPGVQARLLFTRGICPWQLPEDAVAKIDALWARRNIAPEKELAGIDAEMERIAAANFLQVRNSDSAKEKPGWQR
jgi:uncharacterized protein YcgI (DUF1989 family)